MGPATEAGWQLGPELLTVGQEKAYAGNQICNDVPYDAASLPYAFVRQQLMFNAIGPMPQLEELTVPFGEHLSQLAGSLRKLSVMIKNPEDGFEIGFEPHDFAQLHGLEELYRAVNEPAVYSHVELLTARDGDSAAAACGALDAANGGDGDGGEDGGGADGSWTQLLPYPKSHALAAHVWQRSGAWRDR
ncbi:hypothetical protein GPECTOR_8g305 [Gonium pectorale]|uniref:Uncharacterized protein n=1 Tax=Gonium pectorale TaxID=33097 RepID=A0A150GSS6_GONPE|nr:hypothetical protein GPECTOR_8g305 [Gonium pectorale]|eukprot:KXZ52929.1 hypothetical protein GPECTOR_8g305 [Gonium pectorale]